MKKRRSICLASRVLLHLKFAAPSIIDPLNALPHPISPADEPLEHTSVDGLSETSDGPVHLQQLPCTSSMATLYVYKNSPTYLLEVLALVDPLSTDTHTWLRQSLQEFLMVNAQVMGHVLGIYNCFSRSVGRYL